MSQAEFFSAQAVSARNPRRPYGISRVIVGGGYITIALIILLTWIPTLRQILSTQGRILGDAPLAVAVTVRAAIALYVLLAGVAMINRGIGSITRLIVPARAPVNLPPNEWISALRRGELPAYTPNRRETYWLLWRWFPDRLPLLTVGMRRFVSLGLAAIPSAIRVIATVLIFLGFFEVLPDTTLAALGPYRPGVPFLFLLAYAAGAFLHVSIALRTLPTGAAKLGALEFRMSIRGGGDPTHIPHGLLHELSSIRPTESTPNREMLNGFDMPQGGVSNAGHFGGQLLVENQPRLEETSPHPSVSTLLWAGSAIQLLACLWLFTLPRFADVRFPLPDGAEILLLYWLAQVVGAILLAKLGGRMVQGCLELLNTFRFRSLAVVLDVQGNFATSEVKIGRGRDDSIESSNVAVRSDSSVTGYSATLLTESQALTGPRHIIGMIVDDPARSVEGLVRSWFQRFERQGATIMGIDLEDTKVGNIVKANLEVEAHRERTKAAIAGRELMPPENPPTPALIGTSEPSVEPTTGETRVCPECAETIKAAAVKCRFCGCRFDGAAASN